MSAAAVTRSLIFPAVLVAATAAVVGLLSRELSRAWFLPGLQPELIGQLEASLADQRELARRAPESAELRRQRFDRTQALLKRLRILAWSRDRLAQRHAALLLGGAAAVALAAGGLQAWRQSRRDRRLARLQDALRALAQGAADVSVGDRGRDVIGRVGRMVEAVSRAQARDRRRLASLEDLARWQEAARRHAHEMRTPLAAAALDLARLREAGRALPLEGPIDDLASDLRRLGEFAQAIAAFGRLPEPRPALRDLAGLAGEFVERFAGAWPELELSLARPDGPCPARVDADLLRQVLVNLCDNSAAALRQAGRPRGTMRLTLAAGAGGFCLDAADDGPGLPAEARARLFQPYATCRPGGTGLGLAISRKILLDHGGDLELLPTAGPGALFRLWLPRAAAEPAP